MYIYKLSNNPALKEYFVEVEHVSWSELGGLDEAELLWHDKNWEVQTSGHAGLDLYFHLVV